MRFYPLSSLPTTNKVCQGYVFTGVCLGEGTAKGEIEGDLVQVHSPGGSDPGPHPRGKSIVFPNCMNSNSIYPPFDRPVAKTLAASFCKVLGKELHENERNWTKRE